MDAEDEPKGKSAAGGPTGVLRSTDPAERPHPPPPGQCWVLVHRLRATPGGSPRSAGAAWPMRCGAGWPGWLGWRPGAPAAAPGWRQTRPRHWPRPAGWPAGGGGQRPRRPARRSAPAGGGPGGGAHRLGVPALDPGRAVVEGIDQVPGGPASSQEDPDQGRDLRRRAPPRRRADPLQRPGRRGVPVGAGFAPGESSELISAPARARRG